MNRKQRVQFMLDPDADVSRLDTLDIPVTTRTLPDGQILVESTEAVPVDVAQDIERTISALYSTTE